MGVIINEFDVVVEQPPEEPEAAAAGPAGPSADESAPVPEDIRSILRRKEERDARLYAH